MLAMFCLRLACGLIASLLLLAATPLNPRFYRAHYLTAFGLVLVAAFFLRDAADVWLWLLLGSCLLLSFTGSVVWMLEGAPGSRTLLALLVACLISTLLVRDRVEATSASSDEATSGASAYPHAQAMATDPLARHADDLASAALLGTATTAMLIGHSYLIAPGMSIAPLIRLLTALGACTLLRMTLAGVGVWLWTSDPVRANPEMVTTLWLPVRWVAGFIIPLVLGWMAWETARIRSTQSATGILYVVVILCFLGELTSQLLANQTGYFL